LCPLSQEPYHLRSWKSSAGAVLLIWAVRLFINDYDLTVINSPVHQNSCLDFPTAVVISLSRCDFPAVISAQKISAETVCPLSQEAIFYKNIYHKLWLLIGLRLGMLSSKDKRKGKNCSYYIFFSWNLIFVCQWHDCKYENKLSTF
jgi:hypothetical protein